MNHVDGQTRQVMSRMIQKKIREIPKGDRGEKGDKGDKGADGATGPAGPAGFSTVTANTPARTLNSTFRPSTTKPTLCVYSVRIHCSASIGDNAAGEINLLSDANSTPTTVRATCRNQHTVSQATTLTSVCQNIYTLVHLVPAGHYVRLETTTNYGTVTHALISQTEIELG